MSLYLPSQRVSRIQRPSVVLMLSGLLLLTGCSSLNPLGFLSSGVNTAANVQAGKTNNQTVGTTNNVEQTLVRPRANTIKQSSDSNKVQADNVQTVVVNEVPVWVILLLILGWLFPSPNEIARYIRSLFHLKRT